MADFGLRKRSESSLSSTSNKYNGNKFGTWSKGTKYKAAGKSSSEFKFKKSSGLSTLPRPTKASAGLDNVDHIGEISVSEYRAVASDPNENHKRRAIVVERQEGTSMGFTLQTYGLYNEENGELEVWTYVDYVAMDSAAKRAGMRPGDVILSVNGESTETSDHRSIVDLIRSAPDRIRMVVLFQDCVRRVQLHQKLLKLKKLLEMKERQLKDLSDQETRIMEGTEGACDTPDSNPEEPAPQLSLRRSKLTGSLPLLPSYQPKLNKSASMTHAQMARARERHDSEPQGVLGSEIRLLDAATIASVGVCPSPSTIRRYPPSPSFGTRGTKLKRHSAMKKGISPRLGVRGRTERYSSDFGGESAELPSDSDDDDAFVRLSPRTIPPSSPLKKTPSQLGRVRPTSPLVKDTVVKEKALLGVPKVLTILTPRSRTPEPRLGSPSSPVRVNRPNSPLVLERVLNDEPRRRDMPSESDSITEELTPTLALDRAEGGDEIASL